MAESTKLTQRKSQNTQKVPPPASSAVNFSQELCRNLAISGNREWLVTNGLGGFASGTISGANTRRYHGLLFAALHPPVGRTQLVGALDEVLTIAGKTFELATHYWASGAVVPNGYLQLQEFHLDGTIPVWTYSLDGVLLEKRIWMQQGENTTYVRYTLIKGTAATLELRPLVNYRDYHSVTHAGDWHMRIDSVEKGIRVTAYEGATPFFLKSAEASAEPQHIWYRDCFYPQEQARGLEDREDHLLAAIFRAELTSSRPVTLVFSTDEGASLDAALQLQKTSERSNGLLASWQKTAKNSSKDPSWVAQLALAADQFLVKRPLPGDPNGHSVIAGYHWFGDWGRDTMIALHGLTLTTQRYDIARQILLAFSQFVDGGMLPNNFPDAGGAPEYNTIDASLWYFSAVHDYFALTRDLDFLRTIFPILSAMLDAHTNGTRYNIHMDPQDSLLYGGGPGVQLTWMDAKIGDWVVTPRTGKPVEINALWINALEVMAKLARALRLPAEKYENIAAAARLSFQKFWNSDRGYCFDVIDAPGIGNDPTLRPNQIFAVSLVEDLLSEARQKAVVDSCAAQLLTPVGLRSLAPFEPGYTGRYRGGPMERDAAYHQGTVWAWLLGPFAQAQYRVYKDREAALRLLATLGESINVYGLGSLAEIYEGDAPHNPCGCISQAWSIAELLRAYRQLNP